MKKLIAVLIAAALLLTLSAFAEAEIVRTEYEGNGIVEVELRRDEDLDNLAVTAKNPAGEDMTVTLLKNDRYDDDIDFRIENVQPDTEYAFEITAAFGAVSGTVKVPAEGDFIRKVDTDLGDRELEIEFLGRVEFENPEVTITDATGVVCEAVIEELDKDSIEVRISDMTRGNTYTVTVNGVRLEGSEAFGSVSKEFTAR